MVVFFVKRQYFPRPRDGFSTSRCMLAQHQELEQRQPNRASRIIFWTQLDQIMIIQCNLESKLSQQRAARIRKWENWGQPLKKLKSEIWSKETHSLLESQCLLAVFHSEMCQEPSNSGWNKACVRYTSKRTNKKTNSINTVSCAQMWKSTWNKSTSSIWNQWISCTASGTCSSNGTTVSINRSFSPSLMEGQEPRNWSINKNMVEQALTVTRFQLQLEKL